jgi:hypothetical protein
MTKKILIALALGILSGYLAAPDSVYENTGLLMDIGLCLLLFFIWHEGIHVIPAGNNLILSVKKLYHKSSI